MASFFASIAKFLGGGKKPGPKLLIPPGSPGSDAPGSPPGIGGKGNITGENAKNDKARAENNRSTGQSTQKDTSVGQRGGRSSRPGGASRSVYTNALGLSKRQRSGMNLKNLTGQ